MAGAAPGDVLVLGEAGEQSLAGGLAMMEDPTGTLDLAAIRAADAQGAFRPLSADSGLGYRPGAIWVRFGIVNSGTGRQERWLEYIRSNHDSCVLYEVARNGSVTRTENGARIPIAERPLSSRNILFPLVLDSGDVKTYYLRLQSQTATVVGLRVWKPAAYADHLAGFMASKYLGLGAALVLVVYSLLAWQASGRIAMAAAGLAQIFATIAFMTVDGFAADWLPAGDYWQSRVLSAATFLAVGCHLLFAREFLRLPRYLPNLSRAMIALAAGCAALAAIDLIQFVPELSGLAPILLAMVLVGAAIVVARHERVLARTYLVASGLLWVSLAARNAVLVGWLPAVPFVNDLPVAGMVVAAIAMSMALHMEIRKARLRAESARDRLLSLQRTEQDRLLAAVDARTSELREAKARAEQASQAKTDFLSTISHELRTPLHTILGYAQLLRKIVGAETDSKLAIIESSGTQLLRLIDQILDFSRGEARLVVLRPDATSMESLVAHIEDSGKLMAAEGGNRFSVDLGTDVPRVVEVDDHRLMQILHNLISNACKYTRSGRIAVRIARENVVLEGGVSDWVASLHRIRFSVTDSGVGISKEDQARIFEPFSRIFHGSRRQPGVGLGLTIVRQLVQAMGSDIEVDSTPGRGSSFSFALVLREMAEYESSPSARRWTRIVGHAGPARTVLIADDIPENRSFLRDFCRYWGFNVVTAADGMAALALCARAEPPIDAVLIDQFMPEMNGWAFLRAVRESPSLAGMPVILVSAAQASRPAGFPEGMDFDLVLLKPISEGLLADFLQRRLNIEWIFDRLAAEGRAENRSEAAAWPPDSELQAFREMLGLGRVVALQRWADAVESAHPQCGEFAQQVRDLCQAVDLAGLEKLAERTRRLESAA